MICVTGSSGFVGKALVWHLAERLGLQVVVGLRTGEPTVWPQGVQCRNLGTLGTDKLDALDLTGISTLVHCAGRAHIMQDVDADPLLAYRRVNTQGTLDLAQRAVKAGVRRFIFISSIKVNGESTSPGQTFHADDTPHPRDPYAISKLEAEQALQNLARETGLEVVIIRPPLIYGPGVRANFAALMRGVARGWPLPLGAVNNLRSLVALDNLTDLISVCIQHPGAANQTFLVSDGRDVSIPQVLRAMALAQNRRITLLPIPPVILRAMAALLGKSTAIARLCGNLQVNIDKTRQLLDWQPPITLDEGLRRTMCENRYHET